MQEKKFFVNESSNVDDSIAMCNDGHASDNLTLTKIAVLTYPVKHRKTFDVLCLLKSNGYSDVKVFAIPFHYKKTTFPLISHRPEMNYDIPGIEDICKNFNYEYQEGALENFDIESERLVLIAGAGILPDGFIKKHTVINSHPGYIPNCRGLDALKWAIVEKQPIGVTSHLLGEYVDAGEVIERKKISISYNDTFHAVAQRVYENEVSMLVSAIKVLHKQKPTFISPEKYPLHKRMPKDVEENLFKSFDSYKKSILD